MTRLTRPLWRQTLHILAFFLWIGLWIVAGPATAAEEVQLLGPPAQLTADPEGAVFPAVAADAAGNFTVAWLGHFQNGLGSLLLRRYDAGGRPLGPEIEVVSHTLFYSRPRLAVSPGGGMVVTWNEPFVYIRARRLAADGQPVGPVITVMDASCCNVEPDVAFLPSGDFVVVWRQADFFQTELLFQDDVILARLYDAAGVPRGGVFAVSTEPDGARENPRVAADPAGGFVVTWQDALYFIQPALRFRRFNALGSPGGPARALTANRGAYGAVPLFTAAGELSIAFVNPSSSVAVEPAGLFAQRFAADDSPAGAKIRLADDPALKTPLEAADDRRGRRILVWGAPGATESSPEEILFRMFDTTWQPLQPPARVGLYKESFSQTSSWPLPAVAAGTARFLTAWNSVPDSRTEVRHQVFGQLLAGACPQGLCLAEDRFYVEVTWRDPRSGAAGTGTAVPLTGDTGAFWFFSAGNAELLVKVLDGRQNNGHWWVFFGALTDVEFDLTVTDTLTNAQQVYHNPPFTMASHADVDAFSDALPAAASPASFAARSAPAALPAAAPCSGGACLGDFQVTVEWIDPATGQPRQATGVPLSGDSAYFWFFDANNIELIVKVLDGRSTNGHRWVFYGALSDLEYTITVTDGVSGQKKTYHNPHGRMASQADTAAF
jgi:hypothetical protein